MKVIIVGPIYPFRGGIAHFGGCLYKEFKAQGHDVLAINFASQYPSLIFPGKSQFEENSHFAEIESTRVLTPYNPLTYYPTLREIIRHKPDLVIFNYFIPFLAPSYIFLMKKLRKRKIKTLLLAHNISPHEKWLFTASLTKSLLNSADLVMTLSESVRQEAAQQIGEKKTVAGFHPLYDFHNQNRFTKKEAKEKLGLADKKVILFFGYIKPYKGLDTLILSFPMVKKRFPEASLLIVGEVYGDDEEYRQLIDGSGYAKDIILNNSYISDDEVELYFKASDLLAVPYRTATQSGVIQTAYSFELGVVVTPVGGLPEMVEHKKTGIVAQAIDEQAFSQALIDFLSLDENVVKESVNNYKQHYSWKKLAQLFETL